MECKKVCLADERILDPVIEGKQRDIIAGDCMLCGRCIEVCPVKVLHLAGGVPFVSAKETGEKVGDAA
jgi:ferredoxin-type protein NapH